MVANKVGGFSKLFIHLISQPAAAPGPKWVGPRWAQAGPKLVKNLDFFKHHFFAGF